MSWRHAATLHGVVVAMQQRSSTLQLLASVNGSVDDAGAKQLHCAGIIFTVCSEPYLLSEYGAEYMSEAPVKLLERLMHGERLKPDDQACRTCCQCLSHLC